MYPEKIRWILDHKGIEHQKKSLLPGFHPFTLIAKTGQKSVPVLEINDGGKVSRITGSAEIADYLERSYPQNPLTSDVSTEQQQINALQSQYDKFGAHTRRAYFGALLQHPRYAAELFSSGHSKAAQALYKACFPMIKPVMHLDMGITKDGVARSMEVTEKALDQLQIDLDGNDYLVGNQFSLADIAAATVLQVTCLPAEYPVPQGPAHGMEYPPAVQDWLEHWQDHPSIQWVQGIYAKHRVSG